MKESTAWACVLIVAILCMTSCMISSDQSEERRYEFDRSHPTSPPVSGMPK